ncbi:MAG: cytochrome P450 [Pseudomonadota bacterium]|jgi:cytochrome P450|nr:cytochrome P450 [Pseudomonadota bacterium]
MNLPTPPIPPHVSPELIRPYPLIMGAMTDEHPYKTIIPRQHEEQPEVFYALHAYPGFTPAWIFRKARDLNAIYQDNEHFTAKGLSPFAMLVGDTWSTLPVESDPPTHMLYRSVMNPLFSPKKMQALEERVREIARGYIAKFKDKGECELMSEFAFRFPIAVFLELMDMPLDRVEEFLKWEMQMFHAASMEEVRDGVLNVKNYLNEIIEERRNSPGDDFISHAINAQIEGHKLTHDEIFGFCFNLFIGGLDTVSTNMGWHFRHLAENPEHQALLRSRPEMIPGAIEELLRAYSAVATFRTCIKPVTINGVQLMPGDKVAMTTYFANTDPEVYENPSEVRFDRGASRHIAFGFGVHRCVGAPLARRELVIAMEEFFKAIPSFQVKPDTTISSTLALMVQPLQLPLVWAV